MGETIKDIADAIDKLTSLENFFLFLIVFEVVTGGRIIKGRVPTTVIGMMNWLLEWLTSKEGKETGWRAVIEVWSEYFTIPGVISQL